MCRSSRFLCFLLALLAAPSIAEAGGLHLRIGATFGARTFVGMPRAVARPGLPPNPRFATRPGFAGRFRGLPGRFGRFGRGLGYSGYDVAGLGAAGDFPPLPSGGDYGPDPQGGPVAAPQAPPPCIRPMIIKVGKGLRHPAKTRVIYGAPSVCGY